MGDLAEYLWWNGENDRVYEAANRAIADIGVDPARCQRGPA